jgi:hypothetical protein
MGSLIIGLIFNSSTFDSHDAKTLTDRLLVNIERILSYLKYEDDVHFTPSDFDTVDFDAVDLEILFG